MIRRWIILTFLLAIVVRFPLINGSFWLDEAAQVLESQRSFSEQLQIGYDFQPPLLHVIVWGLVRISTNEAFLRSVSLLAGVGSIFFTYLIAQTHAPKNSRVSLLVVALITFSQFHIFYSQELRSYMLATFFGSVSWWLVVTQPFSLRVRSLSCGRSSSWFVLDVCVSVLDNFSAYFCSFFDNEKKVVSDFDSPERDRIYSLVAIIFKPSSRRNNLECDLKRMVAGGLASSVEITCDVVCKTDHRPDSI